MIAPQTGPEAVAGYGNPKAQMAQRQILTLLTTGLAVRSGKVFGNLRVDLQATSPRWEERQIAMVMAAAECTRAQAKAALASCNQHCRTAILMLMTGLDAAGAGSAQRKQQPFACRPLKRKRKRSVTLINLLAAPVC